LFCVVKLSFGTEHFVRYDRVFVITELVITEFHCSWKKSLIFCCYYRFFVILGILFTVSFFIDVSCTMLRVVFTHADLKSTKRQSSHHCFLHFWEQHTKILLVKRWWNWPRFVMRSMVKISSTYVWHFFNYNSLENCFLSNFL